MRSQLGTGSLVLEEMVPPSPAPGDPSVLASHCPGQRCLIGSASWGRIVSAEGDRLRKERAPESSHQG